MGAGRPRRAETDDAILSATLALLMSDGYSGMTVEEVAGRAGVAVTTVYRRWPSKAALVAAAAGTLSLPEERIPDAGNLRDELLALLADSHDVFIKGVGRVIAPLVRESGSAPELVPLVQAAIHQRRRAYRVVMNRATARGEIGAEIDHELVIDVLLGIFWTRMLVTLTPLPASFAEEVVELVLPGLTASRHPREQLALAGTPPMVTAS